MGKDRLTKVVTTSKYLSKWRVEAIKELHRQGHSPVGIARKTGIKVTAVRDKLIELGLLVPPPPEPDAPKVAVSRAADRTALVQKAPGPNPTLEDIPLHINAWRCKRTGQWMLDGRYVPIQDVVRAYNRYVDKVNREAGQEVMQRMGRV